MPQGKVLWFNALKGYGFIKPEDESKADVFVHLSELKKSRLDSLRQGDEVKYQTYVSQKSRELSSRIGAKDIKILKNE
jgi:CspA family cold shock protein